MQHNFNQLKKIVTNSKIMPVIKANAYGHGMLTVANSLQAADGFAVAQLVEAIALREAGIDKPLTVLQGFANRLELGQMLEYRLRPAISQLWQLDLLESETGGTLLDVWLKINTGMARLGIQPAEFANCWRRLANINYLGQAGVMMHFANADEPSHVSNQQQIAIFQQLCEKLTTQTSVSNSAAIISQLYPQQDWVRPGIMLYGSSPFPDQTAHSLGLKAVMSLQAELIAVNQIKKGEQIGYGGSWVCPQDMPVGVVNVGYGDGYPRHAPSGTPVSVNHQMTQLIGRVSMDSVMVDLRSINASCGDPVELWGEQIAVDEVASKAGTISYELLCNAGRCLA